MHADLALDYYRARSLDAEEQLLNFTVKQYEQTQELNQSRFDGGIASEVEVEQAKTQLQTTRAAAQRSLDLSITRYKGGVTSYLEVTTAQTAALSDEVTQVNILGRRMASTVLLIQALGGGWDRSSLPERPECCGKLVSNNTN